MLILSQNVFTIKNVSDKLSYEIILTYEIVFVATLVMSLSQCQLVFGISAIGTYNVGTIEILE